MTLATAADLYGWLEAEEERLDELQAAKHKEMSRLAMRHGVWSQEANQAFFERNLTIKQLQSIRAVIQIIHDQCPLKIWEPK